MKTFVFLALLGLAAAGPIAVQQSGSGEPVIVSDNYGWYVQPSRFGWYGSQNSAQGNNFQLLQQAYQCTQNAISYVQQQVYQGNVPQNTANYVTEQLEQAQQYIQNAQQAKSYGSQYYAVSQAQFYYQNAYQYIQQQQQQGTIPQTVAQYLIQQVRSAQQNIQIAYQLGQSYFGSGQGYLRALIQRYLNKNSQSSSFYGSGYQKPFQYASYGPYSQYYYQKSFGPYQYGTYGTYQPEIYGTYSQSQYGPYQYGAYQQESYNPYNLLGSYGQNYELQSYGPYQYSVYQGPYKTGAYQQGIYGPYSYQQYYGPYQYGGYQSYWPFQYGTFPLGGSKEGGYQQYNAFPLQSLTNDALIAAVAA